MVYRKRIGVWIIFVVACLVLQMIVPLIPSVVINFKQTILDRELQGIIEELHKVGEDETTTETINGSGETTDKNVRADEENAESVVGAILDIILMTSKYIGIVIVVFGVFSMVLGFKDEDAERMSSAVSMMVVGSALIGASTLLPQMIGFLGFG